MEARVAVLEEIARSTQAGLQRLDGRMDRLEGRMDRLEGMIERLATTMHAGFDSARDRQDRDFRLLFAALIAAVLGLAGLMAKGFHWF